MGQDLDALLGTEQGKKLKNKQNELEQLIATNDGAKVASMAEGNSALQNALHSGDMETARQQLTAILKTDEGSRLMQRLSELMK